MQDLRLLKPLKYAVLIFLLRHLLSAYTSNAIPSLPNNDEVIRIVVDAGHGGKDIGTRGDNLLEKDITLLLALELGEQISAVLPRTEVLFTRQDDTFLPVHERVTLANKNKADLFISIHCNSVDSRYANGIETYVLGLHGNEDNLEIATRENASILYEKDYENNYDGFDPHSPAGHIILSAVRNVHMRESIEAAHNIQSQFGSEAILHNRGVKQAGFVVLRKAMMPAILLEVGFLTNSIDELKLSIEQKRTDMVQAIAQGVSEYISDFQKRRKADDHNRLISSAQIVTAKHKAGGPASTAGTLFTILIASSARDQMKIDASLLPGGLAPEEVIENGTYKYYWGQFDNLYEALEAQNLLRENGFNGAYVVRTTDGNATSAYNKRATTFE